jgi:hypothetical protein
MRGGSFSSEGVEEVGRACPELASGSIGKTRVFWLLFGAMPKSNNL